MHMAEITTMFVNSTSTEEAAKGVPTWIIALSIIAGFLALMFVVIGFIKVSYSYYKWKTWKGKMIKNMLTRWKESDTYLATVSR